MPGLRSFLIALCVTASHASPAQARDAALAETDATVVSILDKAIQALGGRDALESMKSVSSHAGCVPRTPAPNRSVNFVLASIELSV